MLPGESYVFALGAYAADGSLLGARLGGTSDAVEASLPLPLPLLWTYLASTALALGADLVARSAAQASQQHIFSILTLHLFNNIYSHTLVLLASSSFKHHHVALVVVVPLNPF